MTQPAPLNQTFYEANTAQVARNLIGKTLVSVIDRKLVSGTIVETEAYLPSNDSACHASKHRTQRTEVMFGPAGFAYVYPIHAKYCFNIVTESIEQGCAVLIRALEPISGRTTIERRRGVQDPRRLTTGPANLCQSLGIDRSTNGHDLTLGKKVWIEEGLGLTESGITIKTSRRIGVTSAKARLLRFYSAGNPYVSGPLSTRT